VTIQRKILDPLALRVLEGDFVEGDTVTVDSARGKSGELSFAKQEMVRS
jgi:ATP-dependent Clp protease ATP-binding subunit ClpA